MKTIVIMFVITSLIFGSCQNQQKHSSQTNAPEKKEQSQVLANNVLHYFDTTHWSKPSISRDSIRGVLYFLNELPSTYSWDIRYKEQNKQISGLSYPVEDKDIYGAFPSNGNYSIVWLDLNCHEIQKELLCTIDKDDKLIDYLPVEEIISTKSGYSMFLQSLLTRDLIVKQNEIKVYGDTVIKYFEVEKFIGQREDRVYQITNQGKFKLLEKKEYKKKEYSVGDLVKVNIREGKEEMEKQ